MYVLLYLCLYYIYKSEIFYRVFLLLIRYNFHKIVLLIYSTAFMEILFLYLDLDLREKSNPKEGQLKLIFLKHLKQYNYTSSEINFRK